LNNKKFKTLCEDLLPLANELDRTGFTREADLIDSLIKKAEKDILSNNKITMIRISLLSMGIKEILGFMGIVGAAFGLGKFGGWFKDKWDKLTGKEKKDAGDEKSVQELIAALSPEELEALYHELMAHKEIEDIATKSDDLDPEIDNDALKSIMKDIADSLQGKITGKESKEYIHD
jgi:hypothetical protein